MSPSCARSAGYCRLDPAFGSGKAKGKSILMGTRAGLGGEGCVMPLSFSTRGGAG